MEVIAVPTMTAEQFLEHPPFPHRRGVELGGADRLETPLLPGLSIGVAAIFV